MRKVAQNRKTFLLLTYRRNMGGGKFVLMKDLSSPILVDARLLGGLSHGVPIGRLNRPFARR
jgi:methyl-accepting chemotaxis protein